MRLKKGRQDGGRPFSASSVGARLGNLGYNDLIAVTRQINTPNNGSEVLGITYFTLAFPSFGRLTILSHWPCNYPF